MARSACRCGPCCTGQSPVLRLGIQFPRATHYRNKSQATLGIVTCRMAPRNGFTPAQVSRYARHLILPEVGGAGQRKLLTSSVLLLGAGGLGSPAGMYLAAAGVGKIGVVDFDRGDASNLQRPPLPRTHDLRRPKGDSAADTPRNPKPQV